MQAAAEGVGRPGQCGDQIDDLGAGFVEQAGLDAGSGFGVVGHADL
jgi:hypothetical protein